MYAQKRRAVNHQLSENMISEVTTYCVVQYSEGDNFFEQTDQ